MAERGREGLAAACSAKTGGSVGVVVEERMVGLDGRTDVVVRDEGRAT
jgi:hypothetical protein